MKIFIVCDHDDHGDPEYRAFKLKADALAVARHLADGAKSRYNDMESYVTLCDGHDGWWFSERGEERWQVTVIEVELEV